jgi:chorismate mutase
MAMSLEINNPVAGLAQCREKIDEVDRSLVALLNERTRVVEKIGQLKKEANLPVYEPRREDAVYSNVAASNQGPLTTEALHRIFERIMDEMRRVQKDRMAGK